MERATLRISIVSSEARFTWTGPDGSTLRRARSVHADDLAWAAAAAQAPPESLAALERLGRRIFSRLMERDIRDAVFAAPSCLLHLHTEVPGIPWELAFGGGRFLADLHAVGRGPETSPAGMRENLRLLMVVDPTGTLPYSAGEASQIASRLRHVGHIHLQTLSGAAATRDAILEALETQAYDVVHFSCHAEYGDTPAGSAFRTYDGLLTAEDLYQAAIARPPALCVLNACESARCSSVLHASGLSTALRAAGATAVVGAQWPVNNKTAGHWMACLYAGLASGANLGEAARAARVETRRLFAHDPYLSWAAFTVDGPPGLRLVASDTLVRLSLAPLVGREREWESLGRCWEDARGGRGRTILLAGPAGSGKTRLVDEWLGSVPTAPVRRLGGDAEEPTRLAPPEEFAMEVLDWARERGAGILVCERLDEAPGSIRKRLAAVVRLAHEGPLLVLVTARNSAAAEDLPREGLTAVVLSSLPRPALEDLFDALGATAPKGLIEATPEEAHRIAMGLPSAEAHAVLADALAEPERAVLRAAAIIGDQMTADDLSELLGMSPSDLWRPLDRLCSRAWLLETNPGVFRFRNTDDRAPILEGFRLSGERQALHLRWAEICAARNDEGEAGLHWLAAGDEDSAASAFLAAFFAATAGGEAQAALEWRGQLSQLGQEPDTAGYAAAVASACSAVGDWDEARRWWRRALEHGDDSEPAEDILVHLAEADIRCGDLKSAERSLVRAEALRGGESPEAAILWADILLLKCLPRQAADKALSALQIAPPSELSQRAALVSANALLLAADPDAAARVCQAGLAIEAPGAATWRTALRRALAQSRQYQGDYAAAEETLTRLADEQKSGRPHEHAATLLALAELWRDQGRLDQALAAVEEAATIGERWHQPALAADANNLRSSILRRQGRYPLALEAAASASETARAARLAPASIHATIHSATVLAEPGELAAARVAALSASAAAESAGYTFGRAWAETIHGIASLERGDLRTARVALHSALEISQAIQGHIGIASALSYLGWVAWDEGAPDVNRFDQAADIAARIAYRAIQYPAEFGRALCLGDERQADTALRNVEALNMGAVAAWLRARRGVWHFQRARDVEALKDLAPAYRVARRLGMRTLHSRAAAALAHLYEAMGDPLAMEMACEASALEAQSFEGWPLQPAAAISGT
jgi:tetratricopeptide (TPR) repeat protein